MKKKSTYEKFIENPEQKKLLDEEYKEFVSAQISKFQWDKMNRKDRWLITTHGQMVKVSAIECFTTEFDESEEDWVIKAVTSNFLIDLFRSKDEEELKSYMLSVKMTCLSDDEFVKPLISQQLSG